jgi:hypothetical protein
MIKRADLVKKHPAQRKPQGPSFSCRLIIIHKTKLKNNAKKNWLYKLLLIFFYKVNIYKINIYEIILRVRL